MTKWGQKMGKMAFRRTKFRRLAWGDGDPYPYTPRATFRYQWEDWPSWEKMWHMCGMAFFFNFLIYAFYGKMNDEYSWGREEALRRQRLRREAQELMVLEGETFDSDIQHDRR